MDTFIDQSQSFSTFAGSAKWNADSWSASSFLKTTVPVVGVPMAWNGLTGDAAFKQIISGALDQDYLGIVKAWAADGYTTMYLRLGWEQNGNWMPWSAGSGQQLADYISAFQHLSTLLKSVSGTNVKIVWNPNADGSAANATASYPGDQYVDVIGVDQYSPSADSTWGVTQAQQFAAQHGKPFAIPETGTGVFTGGGPSAAQDVGGSWPQHLQSLLTAAGAPPTAFVNIWDANVPDGDWAFSGQTSFPDEAAAWNSLAAAVTSSPTSTPASPPPPTPTPIPTPTPTPTPTGTDTLAMRISEDAWKGDAKFTVSVDGHQVGGTLTASTLHASGDSGVFLLTGNWGQGSHSVQVQFLNDAYGGTASTDRNLYVDSIAYDGKTYGGTTASIWSTGGRSFTVGGTAATAPAPADTLTLRLSEDAWQGNAQFELFIDGKQITTPQAVSALHSAGNSQDFTFAGNLGGGSHTIGVKFVNDAYGGTPTTDRNLYVGSITFDGTVHTENAALMSNGMKLFTV